MSTMTLSCDAFTPNTLANPSTSLYRGRSGSPTTFQDNTPMLGISLQAKKDDDGTDKKNKTKKNPTNKKKDRDLYEEEMKMMGNQKTTYNYFDSIVTVGGILFIIVGFALNSVGLDYVVKDGKLTIGTVEDRQFQNEMRSKKKVRPAAGINTGAATGGDTSTINSNVMQMQKRGDLDSKLDE